MADQQHIQWLEEGVESWNKRRAEHPFKPDLSRARIGVLPDPLKLIQYRPSELANCTNPPADWPGIPLSGINLSGANLLQTQLNCADLTDADLTDANLDHANLNQAFLCRAKLNNAKMRNAILSHTKLNGAQLRNTKLDESNLQAASLNDADLSQATVTGAYINNTYTAGTNLVHTDLSDAQYLPPELWKAKLYPDDESPRQYELESKSVETIELLLRRIKDIKAFYADQDDELLFYFRGESQCGWKLRPSVMRNHQLFSSEGKMLLELLSRRPEDFEGVSTALDQWVLAQHHGLKTRFLDITSNPLAALFHACGTENAERPDDGRLHVFATPRSLIRPFSSDTLSVIANFARLSRDDQRAIMPAPVLANYKEAMRRLYYLIRNEKPNFEERIDPRDHYRVIVVEPQQSSERIRAQSGAFLVSTFHQRFERAEILKLNPNTPVYAHYELTVPRERKTAIRDELRLLNVTREKLFPGLDASSETITEQVLASRATGTAPSTQDNWNLMRSD
ncbi:MAG: pentapeptide repeat-containing protein [Gammaproteobacteria bacterium]|nr:pentapeptide repeat-containing protein [Gammaproteobacteria bacterium]MDE0415062.1 pentapeptide repeat-containing protein [Gammaproteobacteria bacterium]